MIERQLTLIMENKPGALARVVGLFHQRGYNIDSLHVDPILDLEPYAFIEKELDLKFKENEISRLTIKTTVGDSLMRQILRQINKLIDVVEASDISEKNIVWRELALIKVKCNESQRVEILELSKVFRVNVVDVGISNITFELAGGKSKIDSFIELLDQFGVIEVMRTGRIATLRGATKIGINDGEFGESDNSDIYIADKDASGSV